MFFPHLICLFDIEIAFQYIPVFQPKTEYHNIDQLTNNWVINYMKELTNYKKDIRHLAARDKDSKWSQTLGGWQRVPLPAALRSS